MSVAQPATKLETAYSDVSNNYKGESDDFYAKCREKRLKCRVYEGDFVEQFGIPTNAGTDIKRQTFAVFHHADIIAVLKDAKTFTSGFIAEGLGQFFDDLIIIAMDGEEHRKVRGLLQPVFMPETVLRWSDKIDHVIRDEYLIPMLPNKRAELMDFGLQFPLRVIYELLGFPSDNPADVQHYASLALAILTGPQVDPTKAEAARKAAIGASRELLDLVKAVVVQRRAENSQGEDLISRLLRAEFEGRKLDDHEIATFVRSLLPAAGETTTRTFSSVMTLLLERPALVERIRNDRKLVPALIDEAIRFEPLSTFKVRQAAVDTEIAGVKIPAGSLVQCMVAAGNRDEKVFDNPDEFDIDRVKKPSFGFGFGVHMCIGQYVAKTELVLAVNAILDLLPNIRLDPTKPAPKITGAMLRGASSIRVIWD